MFDVSSEEITEGWLPRVLALVAAPLVVQYLVTVVQAVIDIFWVGQLGAAAVAAVGLATPILGLANVGSNVAYTGAQVIVSQRAGADDAIGAHRAAVHAGGIVAGLNLLIAGSAAVLAEPIVTLLDPGPQVRPLAITYLRFIAIAYGVGGLSDAVEAGFVGWGETRVSLWLNVTAVLTNLLLDPVLIFGLGPVPRLGIAGAAIATLIGFALSAALGLVIALRGKREFRLPRAAFRPDASTAWAVFTTGAPRAGQEAGRQTARIGIVALISLAGGGPGLTAYTVGARVATIAFVPAAALGAAGTTVVGQNLGAGAPERARRATWLGVAAAVGGLAVVGVLQWVFPEAIARVFVPELRGRGLELTTAYLRILALGYPALGAIWTLPAGFNGAGHTAVPMVSTVLQYWAVRLPIAAGGIVLLGAGVLAAFWAVTLSNIAAAVGLGAYFWYRTSGGMLTAAADTAGAATE